MKRVFIIALIFCITSPLVAFAQTSDTKINAKYEEELTYISNILKSTELKIDIYTESNAEQIIYNEEGEVIGVMGIEKVTNSNETTLNSIPVGQYLTYKVYWYTIMVNYHFYMTIYINPSTGKGEVVRAFDEWYVVLPPGVVNDDVLSIINKYETTYLAAEARYTLSLIAPVSTKMWIYGKVQNGEFITGGN